MRQLPQTFRHSGLLLNGFAVFASFFLLIVLFGAPSANAQFDPPSNYYHTATGTGSTLKQQLHNIIDNHTEFSYNAMRTALQVVDQDPNDSDNIILVYDRVSLDVSGIGGSIPGWDSGNSWNREHTWPRALGVGSSGPDNSDLHQLRPSDPGVNSDRGSLHFGGVYGGQSYGTVFDKGSTVWYPGDADAGMIARQQFYMAVRYDGSDSATEDLELANGTPNGNRLGDLGRLIEWHYEAPADDFELRRNHLAYGYQNNRNPFVDRPEYVWSVFMNQANDSRLAVAGATSDSNGGSSRDIDLGRVFVGSSAPTSTNVTLNKIGDDGTYFDVATTGDATGSITGSHNAFRTGGPDAASLTIGLSGSTSVAGLLSGSVVIDNLDVTTGGGVGRGANDGNDVVSLSLTVLDHATASLSDVERLTDLTHDFGNVVQGQTAATFPFEITNLVNGSSILTANLDVDEITAAGDVTSLVTTLEVTNVANAIAGDETRGFIAILDPSTLGTLAATYTISVSDENLPGAQSDTLTLSLLANVVAPQPGDYDRDGDVDIDDYATWSSTYDSTTLLNADGNGNGVVDASDFNIWRDASQATALAVPEPATGWGLVFGATLLRIRRCGVRFQLAA